MEKSSTIKPCCEHSNVRTGNITNTVKTIAFCLLFLFIGCRKYEEDKGLQVQSTKKRIEGKNWKFNYTSSNDSIAQKFNVINELRFEENKLIFNGLVVGEYELNKESIKLLIDTSMSHIKDVNQVLYENGKIVVPAQLIKASKDQLGLEYNFLGTKTTIHYEQD